MGNYGTFYILPSMKTIQNVDKYILLPTLIHILSRYHGESTLETCFIHIFRHFRGQLTHSILSRPRLVPYSWPHFCHP